MFHSSTTFHPEQYLKLIQAHQHELRAEAARLAVVAHHRDATKSRDRGNQRTPATAIARLRAAITGLAS